MKAMPALFSILFAITTAVAAPKSALPEVTTTNQAVFVKWLKQIELQIADIRDLAELAELNPEQKANYQSKNEQLEADRTRVQTHLQMARIRQRENQLATTRRQLLPSSRLSNPNRSAQFSSARSRSASVTPALSAPIQRNMQRPFQSDASRSSTTRSQLASRISADRLSSRMRSGTQQNRPVAAGLIRRDAGTRLQWYGRGGTRYQVQGSDDLNTWRNIGAARVGTGGADSKSLNTENGPRYYRVVRMN